VPAIPIWAKDEHGLVAGRADALAINGRRVEAAIDWKSDVNPTLAVLKAHVQQLQDYPSATHASRGAIVYLSSGEIVWVRKEAKE
jgi:CRISPR-associated exonuclease Cas4